MRVRAIKDLLQLRDSAFLTEVAEGLGHIIASARRLHDGAITLAEAKNHAAARVLHGLSEEEASKFLILIDAVRCPRRPTNRLSNQLARFNDHLAKGLYARAYDMRPSSLRELQEYIDHYREEFYLDGPNNIDWIFCNEIIKSREEILYVDYVAHEDGHTWFHPGLYGDCYISHAKPRGLQIADLLYDVGATSVGGLSAIADVWRSVTLLPEMKWHQVYELNIETLNLLDSRNLLSVHNDELYQHLVDRWQFPLFTLDLSLLKIDIESLREKQRIWTPDTYY